MEFAASYKDLAFVMALAPVELLSVTLLRSLNSHTMRCQTVRARSNSSTALAAACVSAEKEDRQTLVNFFDDQSSTVRGKGLPDSTSCLLATKMTILSCKDPSGQTAQAASV